MQVPPLPNGLLPRLVYYPSDYYDEPGLSSSSSRRKGTAVVVMAETEEVVVFAYWDGSSPAYSKIQTSLKVKEIYEDRPAEVE